MEDKEGESEGATPEHEKRLTGGKEHWKLHLREDGSYEVFFMDAEYDPCVAVIGFDGLTELKGYTEEYKYIMLNPDFMRALADLAEEAAELIGAAMAESEKVLIQFDKAMDKGMRLNQAFEFVAAEMQISPCKVRDAQLRRGNQEFRILQLRAALRQIQRTTTVSECQKIAREALGE